MKPLSSHAEEEALLLVVNKLHFSIRAFSWINLFNKCIVIFMLLPLVYLNVNYRFKGQNASAA